ncbi:hypothetical protein BGW36DRAFT_427231 [Talaromyces proteolyticus]|uniref:Rhodopsin domain-containing protein n=1 Tax=Talaromyces proteolyticus TaxID=1131652 RepID=A0AAD4KQS1_9EURO|nr:uncharacterized protein BGW36DRAFT_427231 [Talaromyces proteolyticus]KAH8697265.1 hypothetical protein BGW36DRAFT_427231 [Talaromyces proteolyticus]
MAIEEPAQIQGDRAPEIIAVAVVGIAISTIAVVLRFIARSQARPGALMFWWDDWTILATLIVSHGFLSLNIAWTNYGLGKHFLTVPFSAAVPNNNISHASILLYAVCIWLIKITTLLLYARIFQVSRTFVSILWGFGACVTAWFICTAIIPWFNCTPVSKTLNLFEPGVCFNRMPWFYASAFINAFFDLAILLLPLPSILRMQMTLRRKISVVFVFILGYSSAFLSFARFIIIVRNPTVMSTEPDADPTWRTVPLLILSMLEAPLAILALCSPLIGQLVNRSLKHTTFGSLFRSFFSTRSDSSSQSRSGYSDVDSRNAKSQLYSSTAALGQKRSSDENYLDPAPIPMGAISVSRNVEISRTAQSSFV